jgi:hypothetical protein
VVNVTNRAHVNVRLISLESFLCHFDYLSGRP